MQCPVFEQHFCFWWNCELDFRCVVLFQLGHIYVVKSSHLYVLTVQKALPFKCVLSVWHTVEPPLSGLPGISVVRTAQFNNVVCSLLLVKKFWLDKSSRREPTECFYLLGGLFIPTTNSYHWLLDDKTFYSSGEGPWMHCSDFLYCPLTTQHQVIAIYFSHLPQYISMWF